MLERCVNLALFRHDASHVYELPFEKDARYRCCQTYGGTRSHHGDSHFSVDFWMPIGSVICAARSGCVVRSLDTNELPTDGCNSIRICHDDFSVACYAHIRLNGALVSDGEWVDVGQPIALSGNTGCSGRPHLHFHVQTAYDKTRIPTLFRTSIGVLDMLIDNEFYSQTDVSVRSPTEESDNHRMQRRTGGLFSRLLASLSPVPADA
ncbi:M23 family metallopeptidase [Rhodopirellula europaea]|uniref:M23 family metallopeptidase n=1 Tax=Rhodopirellula europaea TaxID=1263866 RepID=UPI0009D97508|nr:M23 family metallopeptidase [Rhodopirellula europaea]